MKRWAANRPTLATVLAIPAGFVLAYVGLLLATAGR